MNPQAQTGQAPNFPMNRMKNLTAGVSLHSNAAEVTRREHRLTKTPFAAQRLRFKLATEKALLPDGQDSAAQIHGDQPVERIDAEQLERFLFADVLGKHGRDHEA